MSNNRPQDVADILEGMDTPTPNEVYEATREYDTNYIAAAAASKAHAGGGGGSQAVISETDPGAIGAGGLWIRLDPSQSYAPMLYVRNEADDGWVDEDGAGILMGLSYYDGNGDVTAGFSGDATSLSVFSPAGSVNLGSGATLSSPNAAANVTGASANLNGGTGDSVQVDDDSTRIRRNNSDMIIVEDGSCRVQATSIGFFGAVAVNRPTIDATPTAQEIVDALVTLGLVVQTA